MRSNRKKILIRICAAVAALLALLALTASILNRCSDMAKSNNTVLSYDPFDYKSSIGYSEPEADIFSDENYAATNRYMELEYEGIVQVYDPQSLSSASSSVKLLGTYFDSAIKGDGATLNSLFTDSYFENYGKPIEKYPDSFAAQKIYKIKVKLVDGPYSSETDAGVRLIERFEVSFLLKDNNGQFRPDLPEPEDGTIPLVFEVVTLDGDSKINAIVAYSYAE